MCNRNISRRSLARTLQRAMTVGLSMTTLLAVGVPVHAATSEQCLLYAVNDRGENDSQIIAIDLYNGNKILTIGGEMPGADLEGLDFGYGSGPNGSGGKLYASSGDNNVDGRESGSIYEVDPATGSINGHAVTVKNSSGETVIKPGEVEISAISTRFTDNSLWGWAEGCGLIKIDPSTGNATLEYFSKYGSCARKQYGKDGDVSAKVGIEDMTWSNDGKVLYGVGTTSWDNDPGLQTSGVERTDVYAYYPPPENKVDTIACLQGQYEAIEMLPNNTLLVSLHRGSEVSYKVLDTSVSVACPEPGTKLESDIPDGSFVAEGVVDITPYDDIEAITWSCPDCIDLSKNGPWNYAKDSAGDSTQVKDLSKLWNVTVGGTAFEIYGIAIRQDHATITVAINSNLPLTGLDVSDPVFTGNIGWGDLIIKFPDSGTQYGVHFAPTNGMPTGLYKNVNTQDVTKGNLGWPSLDEYKKKVLDKSGKPATFWDEKDVGDALSPQVSSVDDASLFNNHAMHRWIPIAIINDTTKKVSGDGFTLLDAGALSAQGLNFSEGLGVSAEKLGEHTFGFSFTKTTDMVGGYVAHLFTECANDGIAMKGEMHPNGCPSD